MIGSPLPLLPIQPLVRAGVFSAPSPGEDYAREWTIVFPGLRGAIFFDTDTYRLVGALVTSGRTQPCALQTSIAGLQFGDRRYWLCESCSARCEDLIAAYSGYLCRQCYRREPSSFATSHRNALLVEADDAIRRRGYIITRSLGPVAPVPNAAAPSVPRTEPAQTERPSLEPGWRSRDVLTELAIDRGSGIAQWPLYDRVVAMSEAERLAVTTSPGYEPPRSVALIGAFPELDIRVLWRLMEPLPGTVIGYAPYWGQRPTGVSVAMMIDLRGAEPLLLIAHRWSDLSDPGWQRLAVHRQSDGRVRFVCPVLGTRCDILYLRDGVFASWKAQRLVHPSQRGVKRRAARKHSA